MACLPCLSSKTSRSASDLLIAGAGNSRRLWAPERFGTAEEGSCDSAGSDWLARRYPKPAHFESQLQALLEGSGYRDSGDSWVRRRDPHRLPLPAGAKAAVASCQ
mmetsp:Transcript_47150/g.102614  ORF Transcript_47150/g.102614 Transcript_47150/m.102614 type:complete len:105 (+) Transcript_47150:2-316(+)